MNKEKKKKKKEKKKKEKMREQENVHKPNYVGYLKKKLNHNYFLNASMRILCL